MTIRFFSHQSKNSPLTETFSIHNNKEIEMLCTQIVCAIKKYYGWFTRIRIKSYKKKGYTPTSIECLLAFNADWILASSPLTATAMKRDDNCIWFYIICFTFTEKRVNIRVKSEATTMEIKFSAMTQKEENRNAYSERQHHCYSHIFDCDDGISKKAGSCSSCWMNDNVISSPKTIDHHHNALTYFVLIKDHHLRQQHRAANE